MKWIDASKELPDDTREVLVSDGYSSYVVAWYREKDNSWHISTDLIEVNTEGFIDMDQSDVAEWCEINRS